MYESYNNNLKSEISKLIHRFYPQIKATFIFENNFKIQNFFKFKDRVTDALRSNIVYKYTCVQCNSTYVGETSRHFHTRICEHMGISNRTGKQLQNSKSNIFKHQVESGHQIVRDNFHIVTNSHNQDLKIVESIIIHSEKPNLNKNLISHELFVL